MRISGWDCKWRVKQEQGTPMGVRAPRRVFSRREIAERAMGTEFVVILTEGFDEVAGVAQVNKQVFVEALITELAVEAFDIGVLRRLARSNKAMPDIVIVAPALERNAGKLRAVVSQQ